MHTANLSPACGRSRGRAGSQPHRRDRQPASATPRPWRPHASRAPEPDGTLARHRAGRHPILQQAAARIDLPGQAAEAAHVLHLLTTTLDRFASVHNFRSGLGLSAPQLGIPQAAIAIRTAHGQHHILLNPQITARSVDTDEDYEGCLSCYDLRGLVVRPLTLHVEHQNLDGHYTITELPHGIARLAAHEIDHLRGLLYTDRMRPSLTPIRIRQYRKEDRPAGG